MSSRVTPPERNRDVAAVPQPRSSEGARLNLVSGQPGPSIHLNLGRENQDFLDERQAVPGLEYLVKYATWNASEDRLLTSSCTPNLQVSIGKGSGQPSAAFSIGSQRFCPVCAGIGFSQSFLQKVVAKAPMFEYRIDFPELAYESTQPPHLEIAMSTFENDSFFCLLRYELKTKKSKVLIFLKARDYLRRDWLLLPHHLMAWFDLNRATLHRHPLMILNSLLEFIHATIIRAELYLRHVKMAQTSLQSLSAVLYNRINKQDTDSMKTIAVVTLVFLPATFVSAIFSTGVFNFTHRSLQIILGLSRSTDGCIFSSAYFPHP